MKNLPTLLAALLIAAAPCFASDSTSPSVPADEALARLKEGNKRFSSASKTKGQPVQKARAATAKSQHPFAIVVGCADSRTAPELVFDQNIGDLFVVRTAGNLADDHGLGSIEYAVGHLGPRLIVVLGHERCGAVAATVSGGKVPGHIGSIVRDIQPAVKKSRGQKGDAVENAVEENAKLVARKIRKEAKLGKHSKDTRVVVGIYDLDSGKVRWVES